MRCLLFPLIFTAATVLANEEFSNGEKCSNGSALYNVTIGNKHERDQQAILYKCRPFDPCPRFCYNAPNCTTDEKAPPNQQLFITQINETKTEDGHTEFHFRCCASWRRLMNCSWTDYTETFEVESHNHSVSDVVYKKTNGAVLSVKTCKVDPDPPQSKLPTKFQLVCYVDSCDRYHACDGIRTGTNAIVVQSDSSPYAAAVLFGLLGLLGITECKTKDPGCTAMDQRNLINSHLVYSEPPSSKGPYCSGASASAQCLTGYQPTVGFNSGGSTYKCASGSWTPTAVQYTCGCSLAGEYTTAARRRQVEPTGCATCCDMSIVPFGVQCPAPVAPPCTTTSTTTSTTSTTTLPPKTTTTTSTTLTTTTSTTASTTSSTTSTTPTATTTTTTPTAPTTVTTTTAAVKTIKLTKAEVSFSQTAIDGFYPEATVATVNCEAGFQPYNVRTGNFLAAGQTATMTCASGTFTAGPLWKCASA